MIYAFTNNSKTIKKIKETGLNVLFANPRWLTEGDFKSIFKGDRIFIDETSEDIEIIAECGKKLGIKLEDYSEIEGAKKAGKPLRSDK